MKHLGTIALFSALFMVSFSTNLQSQTREIGARFSGLDNFDFIYKKEKSENKYLRHRLILANFALSQSSSRTSTSLQVGYALGIEKRKSINNKLDFFHGIEPSIGISIASTESGSATILNPSIGYVLGFQYNINEAFYVSIETIPALRMSFPLTDNTNNDFALNMGFNSNAAAITVAYRFKPKSKN